MKRFRKSLALRESCRILGYGTPLSIARCFRKRPEHREPVVVLRCATSPGCAAGPGVTAVGCGADVLGSGGVGRVDRQSGPGVGAPLPGRWAGAGAVREGAAGQEAPTGRQYRATTRSHGLWRSAGWASALERAAHRHGSHQEEDRSPSGPGNTARLVGKPRAQAVAGKKCGACRRSTPPI